MKISKKLIINVILIVIISGCNAVIRQPEPLPTQIIQPSVTPTVIRQNSSGDFPWWNGDVFYEVFVRSFYDSNADGIGDLQGLIQKLDYLNDGDPTTSSDLGVSGIWLMPIFPSTSYHGYDVTDYYSINPEYGTMEDFKELLEAAHQRGIRVIIDYVINHTSVDHPWFKSARSDKNSPYRDWYIWADEDPSYLGPWDEDVWHYNFDKSYYYGVFWSGMPDLNFNNASVNDEFIKITTFWLSEVGVDGFRVDGARHLIEDGKIQANSKATLRWFEEFYARNKKLNPSVMTVGEVWDSNFAAAKYVKEKAFDLVFDFELSESLLEGINGNDGGQITNAVKFNTGLYPYLQKANFLTNHDMNRVMDVFQHDLIKAKLGAFLLLTIPGVPFIYYGEEIGMIGSKPDEDIRKPMQWDLSEHAGFTTSNPWRAINSNYSSWNVKTEESDKSSLLNLYKNLIQIRNQNESLRIGEFLNLNNNDKNIVSFLRETDQQKILVLANIGKTDKEIEISFPPGTLNSGNYLINSLLDDVKFTGITVNSGNEKFEFAPSIRIDPGQFYLLEFIKQ
ncbi:MAG: alpha-amylase family glycosyl hydrolase [Anaerolineaceae bacterium]